MATKAAPRMDDARGARAPRSGLDRRRLRVGPLAAGFAGDRPARCLRLDGAAGANRAGAGTGEVIEAGEEPGRASGAASAARTRAAIGAARARSRSCRAAPAQPPVPPAPAPSAARTAARNGCPQCRPGGPAANLEKVIPLLHAPDDPGPDGEPQTEPSPIRLRLRPPDGNRLRALFK